MTQQAAIAAVFPSLTSPAWMRVEGDLAVVCAWHEPSAKLWAEMDAKKRGLRVSHGMCDACARKARDEMRGFTCEDVE